MAKFTVEVVQVITQDVTFEVEAENVDDARDKAIVGGEGVTLVDNSDEEYHRNIVVEVREGE